MKHLIFLCFFPVVGFGQSLPELETDRPDQTECSAIVPSGSIQVETGMVLSKDKTILSEVFQQNYATTLIRIGVLKSCELRLIAGEYEKTKESRVHQLIVTEGMKPVEFGLKLKICDEKGIIPRTAFIGHLELPLADKNYRAKGVMPSFRFSMSHTLNKRFDVGYNLGIEWNEDFEHPDYIYTFTVATSLTENWGAYVETFGSITEHHYPNSNVDGGFIFALLPNWQLDLSAGAGLNQQSTDCFLSMGISFRLPN